MPRPRTRDRAARWRTLGALALAVAALGCCCPALPPPALAWQLEDPAPRPPRAPLALPLRAR